MAACPSRTKTISGCILTAPPPAAGSTGPHLETLETTWMCMGIGHCMLCVAGYMGATHLGAACGLGGERDLHRRQGRPFVAAPAAGPSGPSRGAACCLPPYPHFFSPCAWDGRRGALSTPVCRTCGTGSGLISSHMPQCLVRFLLVFLFLDVFYSCFDQLPAGAAPTR